MGSLFENYEQQYSTLTADITAQVGLLSASASKDRRQLISNIEKHVEEAQELLEQMDLEVREVDPSKKQRCRTKLDCYRAELKRLTLEYIKARTVKQESLYDSTEDVRISIDQKQRLLDNGETLERAGRKLNEGYRVALESEEIGHQVLKNLAEQRETIQRSRNRLRETDEELSRSSRLLGNMIMRALQQKVILGIVAVCFLVFISFGIYLSFQS
ncbi:vesicle transport through interaction with t-SNAREs homolog 1A [Anthonomus grandis grandis]|uniref:vesicle transport through interaction with t-SNAREs homolog 1A n=1 Tax=Anthonomus grandis grandis TaxID=2921223 RepID=UPI0021665C0E|nr:vesicle transport through interaction with t-SNAREs homolog 1A [Anthonomus grandis grandis]